MIASPEQQKNKVFFSLATRNDVFTCFAYANVAFSRNRKGKKRHRPWIFTRITN